MESQLELNEERLKQLDKFRELLPDLMAPESAVLDVVYKEGALSGKVKRLIALSIALKGGHTNCIMAQTIRALDAGATTEEVLETLSVQVAMSGTTGIAESLRVIKLLDELDKL